jgi:hypothetical protein
MRGRYLAGVLSGILAGESVTASQIRKARGSLKGGSLKRQPAPRMVA